jgi:hypothetical protein
LAAERDINKAKKILRRWRGQIGKPGLRQHNETRQNNLRKADALDGVCGSCQHLVINFHGWGRSKSVQLCCAKGNSPEVLHMDADIGVWPHCEDFDSNKS